MLTNYLKTSLRSFRRHKGIAGINLVGLAVSLAACLLIGLYVQDELAFDRFHAEGDRLYRMGSTTGWPYGRLLEADYPEVEDVVYLRGWPTFPIEHEGTHHFDEMFYADAGFFRAFDFPLAEGDVATALAEPYSLVLSDDLARRFFGDERALGRTLMLADTLAFTVTGVARVPRRSHIQFDALLSFETLRARDPEWFESMIANGWLDLNVVNYVLLREGADADAFAAKIRDLPTEHAADYLAHFGSDYQLTLTPMRDVYLADAGNVLGPTSDRAYIYLLTVVGIFLLLIASFNFINLATARAQARAKEVGVRKVVGSSRGALIRQFLTESVLLSAGAGLLAAGVALLALPLFNDLAARAYAPGDLLALPTLGLFVALVAVVGVLAGLYPALVLSGFEPIRALTGRRVSGPRGGRLRQGLVVVQFVISGALLVGTLVVQSQLRYMQAQHLGFDAEQVLVVDARQAPGAERLARGEALKQALAAHAAVTDVSATWAVPGRSGWPGQLSFPEGWPEGESIGLEYVPVDADFVETLGLNVIAGRDFDAELATDAENAVIINEAAVRAAGWPSAEAAVGKGFTSPGSGKPEGVVIGVVEDYHQHGLQEAIGPVMFGLRPGNGLLAMRIRAADAGAVVAHVEETWAAFFDGYPFSFFFLDEDFAQNYAEERRLTRIFSTFAVLAIVVACLGLFGLATYTAEQRTKEVGVRKVLGASVADIAVLLSRDFLKLVGIALVIAFPLAYLAMTRWLDAFAYRVEVGPGVFVIAGVLVLLIALVTVSVQAVRTATADPVKSLRYE